MAVYRTDAGDALRLQKALEAEGFSVTLEPYGSVTYLVLDHDRADIDALVNAHSQHAVYVPRLEELVSAPSTHQ